MKITDKYVLFYRDKLGNWSKTPGINYNNQIFPTSEHLFMYLKAMWFGDHETAKLILEAPSPREAKNLGRRVEGYIDAEWDKVREDAMCTAILYRAKYDPEFLQELLSPDYAGKTFVEASPVDNIWGIGLTETDILAEDESNWRGRNLLGKVLGRVRDTCIEYLDSNGILDELKI